MVDQRFLFDLESLITRFDVSGKATAGLADQLSTMQSMVSGLLDEINHVWSICKDLELGSNGDHLDRKLTILSIDCASLLDSGSLQLASSEHLPHIFRRTVLISGLNTLIEVAENIQCIREGIAPYQGEESIGSASMTGLSAARLKVRERIAALGQSILFSGEDIPKGGVNG